MRNIDATALLVVGHGTRSAQGRAEFQELLALISQQLKTGTVHGCFLEMAQPNIPAALQRLAQQGFRDVVVLPLLLFAAGHAKLDIPREARQAAAKWGLQLTFAAPLGTHPQLMELSAYRFREAVKSAAVDPEDVLWVLVGRGSRDSSATTHFEQFASLSQQRRRCAAVRHAFLAMADPRLESIAEEARKTPHKVVVAQPHLLFHGELLQRLQRIVNTQDQLTLRQQWLRTEHLGPHRLLAAAVVDRYRQAIGVVGVRCDTH